MEQRASRPSRLPILAALVAISTMAILWPHATFAQGEDEFEDDLPPPRMVRVHGTVWEVDGSPAAGRLVRFAPERQEVVPQARTRTDGSYSMDLDLRRPQWVEAWVDGVVRSRFFRVAAPQGATEVEVDIQLVPPIVMSGTITLPDGRPAAGMTLKAEGSGMSEGPGFGYGSGLSLELETDAQGHYRVLLREGDWTRYDLYISQEGVGCIGPVAIETDIDRPDMRRDFQLTEGGAVEGIVLAAPHGAPLAGAYVSVATGYVFHGHALSRQATTDEHGTFRFTALPPGRYELAVEFDEDWDDVVMFDVDEGLWAMFEVKPKQGALEVAEGQTVEVEVRMVKELVVTGQVFGPDGSPRRHTMLEGMKVETDGEGRFVYRIRPRRIFYGEVYLEREVTLAPRVPGVGIAVPVQVSFPDGAPQEVDIHLVEPGAVTGRVVYEGTGRPVPGGEVCICPVQPTGPKHPIDDSGRFEVSDMVPGEYHFDVIGRTIADWVTGPVTLTVRPAETVGPLEISVRQRPSFSGRARGIPEQKPLPLPGCGCGAFGLEALVAPAGKPEEARVALVDWLPDGTFTAWLLGPPPPRSDLLLKGGYPGPALRLVSNVIRDVDLAALGAAPRLQFELHPGGTISGRVVAADGQTPLPDVAVVARPRRGDAMLLVPRGAREDEQQGPPDVHTDDEGYFSIGGLLPGEYAVSVEWQREHFGYLVPIRVELAEGEQRSNLQFRAPRDWP